MLSKNREQLGVRNVWNWKMLKLSTEMSYDFIG